jgi:dihydrofolate reductase
MRKIVVNTFLTLDGVMQAPGAPDEDRSGGFEHGGWSVNYWDEMMGEVMGQSMAVPADLLIGRKTYEIFAAHWPHATDDPGAEAMNNARKYVVSNTLDRADWQNSTLISGRTGGTDEVVAQLRRLKEQDGPELRVVGSATLIQTLLAHDLVDELVLWIFPLVLGPGKRLFGNGTIPAGLALVDTKTSTTGVTIATYRRSGAVVPGSFALEQPSDAEIERRRRQVAPTVPTPHPSVAELDALAGTWVVEVDNPLEPGTTVQATWCFEWMEGGHFLIERAPAPPPFPSGYCLIGREDPDDDSSSLVQHYFDSRGVARRYQMTLEGAVWTLERQAEDDDFDQRFRGTFSADATIITGAWERSDAPGAPLHHDFDITYRKVASNE